jgi:2-keto-4-pentenoate hydratase/2-oxohepta-3-ene-1,7-dioic acid hydratase in catechol pathway
MTLPFMSTRSSPNAHKLSHNINKIERKIRMDFRYSLGPRSSAMKITRYVRYGAKDKNSYGVLEDQSIRELRGDIFKGAEPTGNSVRLSDARLLAPCEPSKVIAIGRNYKSHIADRGIEPAKEPGVFWKPSSCIIGTEEDIVFPEGATNVHYEAELVVVIGKHGKNIAETNAANYIFGVTAGNDVSARDWQKNDLQWFRAKGSDTFGALGPCIVQGLNYNDLLVQSRLNGEVRQSQRTSDLIFPVDQIVSYVSRYVALFPGDIIYTGTPGVTKAMVPGDVIEIEVEGVGTLRNRVSRGTV